MGFSEHPDLLALPGDPRALEQGVEALQQNLEEGEGLKVLKNL